MSAELLPLRPRPPHSYSWDCPSCTTRNELANVNCSVCLEPKPGHRRLGDQLEAEQNKLESTSTGQVKRSFVQRLKAFVTRQPPDWTCPRCTQIMGGHYNQCTACKFIISGPDKSKEMEKEETKTYDGTAHTAPPNSESSEGGPTSLSPKWECKRCTYNNDDKLDKCAMCSTRKLSKPITLESLNLEEGGAQPKAKRISSETILSEYDMDSPGSKASRVVSDSGRETMSATSSGRNTPYSNIISEELVYDTVPLNPSVARDHSNHLVVMPTAQSKFASQERKEERSFHQPASQQARSGGGGSSSQKLFWSCSFCRTKNFKIQPDQKCLVCGIGSIPQHLLNVTVQAANGEIIYSNEILPVENEPAQQQQQEQPSSQTHGEPATNPYYPTDPPSQYLPDCLTSDQTQFPDRLTSDQTQFPDRLTSDQTQFPDRLTSDQTQFPDRLTSDQTQFPDRLTSDQTQFPDRLTSDQTQFSDCLTSDQTQFSDRLTSDQTQFPDRLTSDYPADGQYLDHPDFGQNHYPQQNGQDQLPLYPPPPFQQQQQQQPYLPLQQQQSGQLYNHTAGYQDCYPPQGSDYYDPQPPQALPQPVEPARQLPFQPVSAADPPQHTFQAAQANSHYQMEQPQEYFPREDFYQPPSQQQPALDPPPSRPTTQSQFTLDLTSPRGGGGYRNFFSPLTPGFTSHHQRQLSDQGPQPLLEESMTQMVNCTKLIHIQQREDEREATVLYSNIRDYCQQNCEPFTDPDFPPADRSLYFDPKKPDLASLGPSPFLAGSHDRRGVAVWLRPREVFTSRADGSLPWAVFRNPGPEDIVQGILGDCWLLGALSVIASQQGLLEKIVVTRDYSPDEGAYQVRLCKDGKWVVVVIDDSLPCYHDYRLVFSKANRRQLWVPLIEKAVAKLFGCYQALNNGTIISGLSVLTGLPCEKVYLKKQTSQDPNIDYELVWAQLVSSRDANFPMGASCGHYIDGGSVSEGDYDRMGLELYHAYSVLDVRQLGENRLLQLRNPWGKHSWRGAWSDGDGAWQAHPRLREQLHPLGEGQGIFWISFQDFATYFCEVDVCKYRPGWYSTRMEGVLYPYARSHYKLLAFEVTQTTEVDISIYQPSLRGAEGKSQQQHHQVDLAALVLQYPSLDGCESVDSIPLPVACSIESGSQIQSLMTCSGFLEPGRYAILPLAFNHWQPPKLGHRHASTTPLSPHGSGGGRREEGGGVQYMAALFSARQVLYHETAIARTGFLAEALYLLATKTGTKSVFHGGMYIYEVYLKHACRVVVAVNESSSHHFTVTCDAADSANVVSTRGELFTQDCIPPKHWQILQVVTQLELARYKLYMQIQFARSHKNLQGRWGALHLPEVLPSISELHSPRLISS